MSREQSHEAIVLKKQPFGEADELITFYTRDAGKVRGKAVSIKLPKAKLQGSLQLLFRVQVRLSTGQLPRIIGCVVDNTYKHFREYEDRVLAAYVVAELMLRATPDGQPNQSLFDVLDSALVNLEKWDGDVNVWLCGFKVSFLQSLGLLPELPGEQKDVPMVFVSAQGGFVYSATGLGYVVQKELIQLFRCLVNGQEVVGGAAREAEELNRLLSEFIEYQLERRIVSEDIYRASKE